MKSPLSRESDAPHVHPRPRKRPPRCTLDCGFKTAESPALRGFVAGAAGACDCGPLSVLKSNGFHHSENLPVKFVFSSKTVPANIAQKLPSQRCSQPFLIPLFNFSHKWPTFAFTSESGYTLGFQRRIAHSGSHAETGAFRTGVVSLPSERSARSQTSPGRVYSRRTQRAFGTAMRLCASLFRRRRGPAGLRRATPPAERTVLAPISPRVQLCLRRPAFPLSAFIPGA